MENLHRFTVREVGEQLRYDPKMLHVFLHALFQKDPNLGAEYHNKQVELYAQYDPTLLRSFLQNSNFYDLEQALKLCKEKKMYNEMVFILKRMGSDSDALMIIIYKLQDVKQAIEFVETSNDDELWEVLIKHSLESNLFLSDLLGHVGDHYVDSLKLVTQIPENKDIPQLKRKILNIFTDKMLQVSVQEGCVGILKRDCAELNASFVEIKRQGVMVDNHTLCCFCKRYVLNPRKKQKLHVYWGGTVAHAACYEAERERQEQAMREQSEQAALAELEPISDMDDRKVSSAREGGAIGRRRIGQPAY
eukprot:CAMPEP_0170197754 /NCGR_PEP_ID=MMETSP0040_2-20121228/67122_1 /TAXON_ID=641309 /ORGANISM="Lotharella oceanica, Strain CCMP622" /LENGTH=304 /DNA_ID=CAMNT_0010447501 /DNA_START=24 /DNA_END=938 /DNA_ORIENTATION=+